MRSALCAMRTTRGVGLFFFVLFSLCSLRSALCEPREDWSFLFSKFLIAMRSALCAMRTTRGVGLFFFVLFSLCSLRYALCEPRGVELFYLVSRKPFDPFDSFDELRAGRLRAGRLRTLRAVSGRTNFLFL
jgi:hypothetical protein